MKWYRLNVPLQETIIDLERCSLIRKIGKCIHILLHAGTSWHWQDIEYPSEQECEVEFDNLKKRLWDLNY